MSGADLIIFDCDGVLVDSEPLSMRTLVAAIGAQGFEVTIETAYRDYLGRSLASISSSLRDSHGAPLSAATLESMRHDLYALYRRELTANPGVADVLDTIGIPFCVASSSSVERVKLSLELSGLLPRFGDDRIFSSSMVTRGKPAPDLFLHVAKTLGARPERCVVIGTALRESLPPGRRICASSPISAVPMSSPAASGQPSPRSNPTRSSTICASFPILYRPGKS